MRRWQLRLALNVSKLKIYNFNSIQFITVHGIRLSSKCCVTVRTWRIPSVCCFLTEYVCTLSRDAFTRRQLGGQAMRFTTLLRRHAVFRGFMLPASRPARGNDLLGAVKMLPLGTVPSIKSRASKFSMPHRIPESISSLVKAGCGSHSTSCSKFVSTLNVRLI
jgi:hypothetical protein